jgi:hypothetical protein
MVFIAVPVHWRLVTDDPYLVWNQDRVSLLKLDGEQAVERVVETDRTILALAPLTHACALP